MARRTATEEVVVDDGFEDFEIDDVDNEFVEDITPVEEAVQVEDLGAEEVPVPAAPTPPSLATTQSFFAPTVPDVEDLGVQIVTPDQNVTQVAVTEDIGPVYYGARIIEMYKGRLYNVTDDVYEYLYARKKLVGQ